MRVTIITTSLAVFATAKAAVIPDASSTDLAIHAADVPSSAISAAALQNPGIAVSFDDAANMAISNDAVVKRDDEEDDPDLEDDDPDLTIDVIKYSSSNCAGEGDKHKLKSGTCKTIDHVFGSYFVRPHEPLPMIGGILHHWDTTFDDPRCTVAVYTGTECDGDGYTYGSVQTQYESGCIDFMDDLPVNGTNGLYGDWTHGARSVRVFCAYGQFKPGDELPTKAKFDSDDDDWF